MEDKVIGNVDAYTVMYTEDYNTICSKCCISNVCQQEGYCKCDDYRDKNEISLEGDIYFIYKTSTEDR